MKLKLTKEMIELATQHQNRSFHFKKFEKLVRDTYPDWKNASRNEIYKKFDLIYERKEKIEDLTSERNICINLMKEQVTSNFFNKEVIEHKNKKNYEYWYNKISDIDKQLISNGYKPNEIPTYDSLTTLNNVKNILLILPIIIFVFTILFIIF